MSQQHVGVGQRVAEMRRLAGWSQPRLAAEANVSTSLVRAVEQGRAPASAAFISACAKALRMSAAELMGQPYPRTTNEEREVSAGIAIIRSEVAAYDLQPAGIQPRPLAAITDDVELIRKFRRSANFHKLSAELPSLLTETRAAMYLSSGHQREQACVLLCELYSSARSLAHKLGYTDLATMAVERLWWAAHMSGDKVWMAAAQFHRASVLTSAGDWNSALTYLDDCRADMESRVGSGDPADLIGWGSLHLQSGLAAARAGDRDTADAHLAEAKAAADRIGNPDFHDPVLSFGTANVGIWSVSLAVEMMDGTEAVKRADGLVIPASTPKSRVGHMYIDLARGFLLHGDRARTMGALQTAKKVAPTQTRYHPQVHETVRVLARAEARSTETLRGFAAWCGIA
ncbi:helix-turn-helix transcriptional regulator [Nocardia sp. NPDC051990]|uniref:helix-turn-helix domain-containing protein n=1 Tax=Nocardia sp. NPDC051990 TaxID=3155285 RepID=UPI0034457935